jgi:hypothetical protein
MLADTGAEPPAFYAVDDPARVGGRVTLTNSSPIYICAIAKKVKDLPIFATVPQQSDYVARWRGSSSMGRDPESQSRNGGPFFSWTDMILQPVKKLFPKSLKKGIKKGLGWKILEEEGLNRPWFHKVSLQDMAAGRFRPSSGYCLK